MASRVTRIVGGVAYEGDFEVKADIVILSSEFGQKRTQKGSLSPEYLAGVMLGEQIAEHFRAK